MGKTCIKSEQFIERHHDIGEIEVRSKAIEDALSEIPTILNSSAVNAIWLIDRYPVWHPPKQLTTEARRSCNSGFFFLAGVPSCHTPLTSFALIHHA